MARAHGNIGLMTSLLGRAADGRQAMRAALQMAQEMRMHELRREMLLNLAYLDLHEGAPQAALATLGAAWDAAETFTRESSAIFIRGMQVRSHMQRGELGIALGLADDTHQRALALGEPAPLADCASMTLDLEVARLHALRLSGLPHTTQTAARAACADAAATLADARTPALAALALRQELASFARAAGDAARAARLADEQQAQLQRLASTLDGRRVQQTAFQARWPLLQR